MVFIIINKFIIPIIYYILNTQSVNVFLHKVCKRKYTVWLTSNELADKK